MNGVPNCFSIYDERWVSPSSYAEGHTQLSLLPAECVRVYVWVEGRFCFSISFPGSLSMRIESCFFFFLGKRCANDISLFWDICFCVLPPPAVGLGIQGDLALLLSRLHLNTFPFFSFRTAGFSLSLADAILFRRKNK